MTLKLFTALGLISIMLFASAAYAQHVAVYPVKTEGFKLNQGEVSEMNRIALQACFDVGLTCSERASNAAERERQHTGVGQTAGAAYVAECAAVGKTEDRFNVGTKKGGLPVWGGASTKIDKTRVFGHTATKLSGLRFGGDGMNVTCQFSRTADGILVYSSLGEKVSFSGELVLAEGRSSNVTKLHKAFRKMFDDAKPRLQ